MAPIISSMPTSRESVLADRKFHIAQLARFRDELSRLRNFAPYRLVASRHGKQRYYTLIDGIERKYVGKDDAHTVRAIQKRRFLTESIARMNSNLTLIDDFLMKYRSLDPEDIMSALPNAYRFNDSYCFDISGAVDVEEWDRKEYRRSQSHPEHLTHIDSRGELTRSKSEVIIANALTAHRIPYKIEQPVYIGRERRVPDFIAFSKRLKREMYWEHFGLMSKESYRLDCIRKLDLYSGAGILPGYNLIMTYDDKNGNIDAREIELMIQMYF